MKQPKTIANTIRKAMEKALKDGRDEVIMTDANGHELAVTYQTDGERMCYFVNERVSFWDKNQGYTWTHYCEAIEDELNN